MTDCKDCERFREYLTRRPNREATTSEIEVGLEWNRHRIATHRRHLERGGELILGRLLRRRNRALFIERRRGRKHWHHLLSPTEDRELGAQGLREILDDLLFMFRAVPPRGSSGRQKAVAGDLSRLLPASGIPFATEGEETFGEYVRRLNGLRFVAVMDESGRTERRELVRVIYTDGGHVA